MARFLKHRVRKTGIESGTLVHIGQMMKGEPKITVTTYDQGRAEVHAAGNVKECLPLPDKKGITWISINGLHDKGIMEDLGEHFGFHPLFLEDIMNTDTRLKVEDFGEYIFMVMKFLSSEEGGKKISSEQVSLIFGKNYLISFQESEKDRFSHIRDTIVNSQSRARAEGTDYLAYLLIDLAVDQYFNVLEGIGDAIDEVEEILLGRPDQDSYQRIHGLKNNALFLRKSVFPLREILDYLEHGESKLIRKSTRIYYKDVYDHTVQIMETLDTYRDMISGMLDMYLSSVSNRLNEIMKVLTIFSTIFIPLTFLAGVYGMNFHYLPELEWRWSYPAFWLFAVLLAGTMLFIFKRKGWL